jgi:hypothetical protein
MSCATNLEESCRGSQSARTGVDCHAEVCMAFVKPSRASSMSSAVFSWMSSLMRASNLFRNKFQSVYLLDRNGSACFVSIWAYRVTVKGVWSDVTSRHDVVVVWRVFMLLVTQKSTRSGVLATSDGQYVGSPVDK